MLISVSPVKISTIWISFTDTDIGAQKSDFSSQDCVPGRWPQNKATAQSTCCCHARPLAILTAPKQGQGTGTHNASLLALRPLKLTCGFPHSLYPDDRHSSLYCFLRILILLVSIREACGCLKETQSDVEKHRILRGHMVWFNSVSSVVILFSVIDEVGL